MKQGTQRAVAGEAAVNVCNEAMTLCGGSGYGEMASCPACFVMLARVMSWLRRRTCLNSGPGERFLDSPSCSA